MDPFFLTNEIIFKKQNWDVNSIQYIVVVKNSFHNSLFWHPTTRPLSDCEINDNRLTNQTY